VNRSALPSKHVLRPTSRCKVKSRMTSIQSVRIVPIAIIPFQSIDAAV